MIYGTESDSKWGEGRPVTTQSMIKAFLTCPMEVYYKYHLRLQPKQVSLPLTRGKWIHALLETYYKARLEGDDHDKAKAALFIEHARWSGRFAKLFDEEKERLGDLPREIIQIIDGYFWHYGDPKYQDYTDWEVVSVEQTLEAEMPNGHIFRGRFDMLVENVEGLWLVDHKSHKNLPDWAHRMMDIQAPMYVWAARESGIPVRGFIWNYLGTSKRTVPEPLANGQRLSKTGWASTTYPAVIRQLKDLGWIKDGKVCSPSEEHDAELRAHLRNLRSQRWAPNMPPSSPFYRRDELTHDDEQIARVLVAATRTSDRMHAYDFEDQWFVERNPDQCKGWKCNYKNLSMADLVIGDSSRLRKTDYQIGDPLAYYGDTEGE